MRNDFSLFQGNTHSRNVQKSFECEKASVLNRLPYSDQSMNLSRSIYLAWCF